MPPTSPTSVAVGIPTYRRPELLTRLLTSLAPEIAGRDVLVVVADNDAGEEAPRVAARAAFDVVCVPVREPGISATRNALIRTATAHRPGWTHLIMLDDDGYVTPGWFDAILAAIAEHDADVLGGPVLGQLPENASRLARNSVYASRTRHTPGRVTMLNGAQNIAVSRAIVDRIGDPWFPPELGRAGGEDHWFFRRVLELGGTLAWTEDAQVVEPTPAERLTASAMFKRTWRSNVIAAQTDRRALGRAGVGRWLLRQTPIYGRNVAAALIRRDPDRLAKVAFDTVGMAGRAFALVSDSTPTARHGAA